MKNRTSEWESGSSVVVVADLNLAGSSNGGCDWVVEAFSIRKKLRSPNKRSFRGPGDVVRALDSQHRAQICVRELASVPPRGLPLPPAF